MNEFKKFRKIRQFKDVIQSIKMRAFYAGDDEDGRPIYDSSRPLPKLTFRGTVKLHGTNAGISYCKSTDELTPQKRTSNCGGTSGHFGFVEYIKCYEEFFKTQMRYLCDDLNTDTVYVFGEWCGAGIQKKVAISELTKRFVVFSAYDPDADRYFDEGYVLQRFVDKSKNCFSVCDYETFEMEIDVQYPELAVNKINSLVEEVEKVCPVSKAMLLEEKPGRYEDREEFLGEGIVWTCGDYCFKTKGYKHAKGGGKMATVDPIKAQSVKEFIDKVVTEDRLQQCWDIVSSNVGDILQMKHIGELMKWIFNDIMDEEGDALVHNNLCKKDVSGAIANAARPWFIKQINSF